MFHTHYHLLRHPLDTRQGFGINTCSCISFSGSCKESSLFGLSMEQVTFGMHFKFMGTIWFCAVPKSLLKNIVGLVSKGKSLNIITVKELNSFCTRIHILHQNSGKILEQSSKNAVSLQMMNLTDIGSKFINLSPTHAGSHTHNQENISTKK